MDCYHQVGSIAKTWGFLPPLPASFPSDDACELWVSSVLVRVLDPKWWERRINGRGIATPSIVPSCSVRCAKASQPTW